MTVKQSIEELVEDLKGWSKQLAATDSDKAREVGQEIAKYADSSNSYGWKYKLEAPLKELSSLQKNKIGLLD